MAVGKIVVSLVSLILVVGVICGVIGVVNHNGGDNKKDEKLSTSMKAVTTICEPTEFKDACVRSLGRAAKNESANLKDFVLAAIEATTEEVKKAFDVASKQNVNKETDPYDHMGVEDCKELLEEGIDNLQASFSMVGDAQLHTLNDRVRELLNWLYAVYSFQTQCVDSVEKPEYKSAIENGMVNATQLTSNLLTIVDKISEYLKAFNVSGVIENLTNLTDLKPTNNNRRLLEVFEVGHDEYPTWFSVADRKLLARPQTVLRPNAVVAKDGSGQFKTIGAALAAYPKKPVGRYIIYVKAGIYDEIVRITKNQENVFIYGDGARKTIVTGKQNFGIMKINTMNTATFACDARGFIARGMTIRNTAGPDGHQAVALRIKGDQSAVFNCNIEGYQDTLYYHQYRQFYRNCVISGTIDFLFGEGSVLIQNSLIIVRKPGPKQNLNTVTADGRQKKESPSGLVIQNCRIVPERSLFAARFQVSTYLGRPWKAYANTIIMESDLGDFIRPEGYMPFQGQSNENTCSYLEFANRGPGSRTQRRVRWKNNVRVIDPREAGKYTAGPFLQGGQWLPQTSSPFHLGFTPRRK